MRAFIEVTATAMARGAVAVFTTILNLLPVPTLDGGEILIAAIETRRSIRPHIKDRVKTIGHVTVLFLTGLW
jgi:membrane-associated protease RseP (regulator of RpoE activity)